jgi:uncharacterized protein (TIGR03000 family)
MYSMVLLAALTTATDTPDFGRGGCCGCRGGWGGWGGCHGCYGGWGGCYGGWGGCYGGWGGCYGGCGGCYGGWGGYGSWAGSGGLGYTYASAVPSYASPVRLASNSIPSATLATRSMYSTPTTAANNRATIIVHVPDDATLMIDGHKTTSASSTRRLYSPPLEPGKSYHYNLEAIVTRDGKPITVEQRVDVRAGAIREVTITMPDRDQKVKRENPPAAPAERRELSDRRVGLNSP